MAHRRAHAFQRSAQGAAGRDAPRRHQLGAQRSAERDRHRCELQPRAAMDQPSPDQLDRAEREAKPGKATEDGNQCHAGVAL
jgi:hypothetical protein